MSITTCITAAARRFAVRTLLRNTAAQRGASAGQTRDAELAAIKHLANGCSASTAMRLAETRHLPPRDRVRAGQH